MVQSLVRERPSPGSRKPNIGETYSQAMARVHQPMRGIAGLKAPTIQNTAAMQFQPRMRRKLWANSWRLRSTR